MRRDLSNMLSRGLALLLVFVLAFSPMAALPVEAEASSGVEGGVAWTLDDAGVLTISPAETPGNGYEVGVMPMDYDNSSNKVPWNGDMGKITSLVVESGVTVLGNRVCNGAENLKSISLPEGLVTIGDRCFSDCSSLTEIYLPDSVTTLGKDTIFNGCTGLTEVDISNTGITVLPKKAFSACTGLTTITLPKLTSIGESCFGATSGVGTANLKRINYAGTGNEWSAITVDTTGNAQLKKCTIYCTDGIYSVNSSYDAVAYTPEGYTVISGQPFAWKVTEGELEIIGYGAIPDFAAGATPWNSSASSITSVKIDQYITSIGDNAFEGCANFTYTYDGDFDTLKENSSQTGNEALFGGEGDGSGDSSDDEKVEGGVAWTLKNGVLTLSPAANPDAGYEVGEMPTDYTVKEPSEGTANPVPWIDDMTTITTLVVNSGVTILGNRLLNGAKELKNISLPEGLTEIGDRCFSDCVKLTEIHLPNSLTKLGATVFNGCTGLTVVDISNTKVTALGEKAFAACSKLTTLSIPGTVTSIAKNCFGKTGSDYTNKLAVLNFGGTLATWNAGSFVSGTGNTNLTNGTCIVYCTDGIWIAGYTSIADSSLAYKLESGTLTIKGTGAMPDYAAGAAPWHGTADSITKVVLGEGITSIGANAFEGCASLTYTYGGDFDTLKANSSTTGNEALFGDNSGDNPGDDTDENIITGTTGNVTYSLDKTTGIMTLTAIEGKDGATASYAAAADLDAAADWKALIPQVKELVVSEGVTALGARLFTAAGQLTKITLPSTLVSIGNRCFINCAVLTTVDASAATGLTTLGQVVFNGCTILQTVDLSDTKVTSLPYKTFAACPALTSLYIPVTVKSIGEACFGETSGSKTLNLTAIYYDGYLADWEEVTIHETENTNLTNGTCVVYCTDGIWISGYESAGGNLVYKINNGTLTISGTGAMPDYAEGAAPWYGEAADITSVVLEEGITSIGDNAFDGFTNLTSVSFDRGVATVGSNAFADCANLQNVAYTGTEAQWQTLQNASESGNDPLFDATMTSGFKGTCGDNAVWSYDETAKTLTISGTGPMWDWNNNTYKSVPWSRFNGEIEKIVIGYGITATGRYAFCYLDALEELVFETDANGFTKCEVIGGYCFCWNNTLETLVLPEGVRFISGRGFSRVENIKTVYLPSTLKSVDMYAFKSEDSNVTISKVYYNGTKEDIENIFVSTQGDNDKYFLPDNDTEWIYLKEYDYYDDVPADSTEAYKDAVYYLKDQEMLPEADAFGVNETADMEWVLRTLYVRAGSSGAYADGLDWAKAWDVVTSGVAKTDQVSLTALAEMLYRTALYNGHPVDLGDSTALAWCQSENFTSGLSRDTVLTRAQAATVLTAFLQSDYGNADRYDEMRDQMKTAYKAGGDGKMYILALHHGGKGKYGDSTLILLPGGQLMLIDTFRSDGWTNYLKATLDYLGAMTLDYLVLSHGHEDHDANLSKAINYIYDNGYTVKNYWSAGRTTSTSEKNAISLLESKGGVTIKNALRTGDKLTIGEGTDNEVVVDILWPTVEKFDGDSNDHSLTMKLTYGESSYITGGDLFQAAELAIVDLYKDNPEMLEADVMKTNHHGSYSSNSAVWVEAVDPKVLITHSDDTGDSAQCYMYSQQGRAWYGGGRDGGVLVVMDSKDIVSVTTGYDTDMREYLVLCGDEGHEFEGQPWEYDENGHWRKCAQHWLCGATEAVQEHTGGTATTETQAVCENCGTAYGELLPAPGEIYDLTQPEENDFGGKLEESVESLKDKIFSADDKRQIALGLEASFYMFSNKLDAVPAEEEALVRAQLGADLKMAFCVDISLYKQIGSGERVKVTRTNEPIRLGLELPAQCINQDPLVTREFGVIRVHNGVAQKIESSVSEAFWITIETDRFSTYVVYYKDTQATTDGGEGDTPGGDTSGGGDLEGDAPGGDTPGGNTPDGDTSGGNASGGNNSGNEGTSGGTVIAPDSGTDTGDSNNITVWIVLMIVCAAVIAVVSRKRKSC